MTTPPKSKPRKKPNPYRAPNTVKRYYKGIDYGIHLFKDNLIKVLKDKEMLTPELETEIKGVCRGTSLASTRKLTELEKYKTEQKIKEWKDAEWERI